jgi:ABC-2 type transport system ATP-binding protein
VDPALRAKRADEFEIGVGLGAAQAVTQIKTTRLPEGVLKEVEALLAKHGSQVLEVDHPTTSLEDLFVKTVRESAARPGQRYVPPSPGSKPPAGPVKAGVN